MKSKQEILNEVFSGQNNSYASDLYLKAMDEYARELAVHYAHEFLKMLLFNCDHTPQQKAYNEFDEWVKNGFTFL